MGNEVSTIDDKDSCRDDGEFRMDRKVSFKDNRDHLYREEKGFFRDDGDSSKDDDDCFRDGEDSGRDDKCFFRDERNTYTVQG